jgi:predicted nucleotidyltransferase
VPELGDQEPYRVAVSHSRGILERVLRADVDLLVEFAPGAKSFDKFMALAELLEEPLGRRVELVTTEVLSPFIGPKILAEAQDVLRAA